MSPDSIPQISLGSAALIVFAICASFMLLRGVMRAMISVVVLGLSGWIAFLVWQQAPALSLDLSGRSIPWITVGLPVAAFVISFLLIRSVVKFISRPFGNSDGENRPRTAVGTAFRLVLAVIPAVLIWLVGAAIIHHQGSIDEIRSFSKNAGDKVASTPSFTERLKAAVEAAVPADWLAKLDPATHPARLALAKLIAAQAKTPLTPVIDQRTGRPIPRAVVVEEPELQNLAREGNFGTLLRHPLLTKALADPKIQQLLRDLNL